MLKIIIGSTWQTGCVSRVLWPAAARQHEPHPYDQRSRGNATLGQQNNSALFILILPSFFLSVALNHLLPSERRMKYCSARGISRVHLHSASLSSFSNSSHMLPKCD